jgi:putative chitinase
MIDAERMRRLAQGPAQHAFAVANFIEEYREAFGVTTPLRVAHLMAQLCYESDGFQRIIENLNYSAERIAAVWPRLAPRAAALAHNPQALANAAYGSILGNGDEASGDGFRFRGRGLIELTGRDNYRARGVALGIDLVGGPDQAADPEIASRIALSFWQSHGCNEAADSDDVTAVTHRINPALMGLNAREALTARAKTIFTAEEGAIA